MVREGQANEALPWVRRAVELDPTNATFQEILAEVYMEREEPADAIAHGAALASSPRRSGRACTSRWAGPSRRKGGWTRPSRALRDGLSDPARFGGGAQLNIGGPRARNRGRDGRCRGRVPHAAAGAAQLPGPHASARLATLLRGKLPDEDLAAARSGWPIPTWPGGPARLGCSSAAACSTPAAITTAPASASARPTPSARSWPWGAASTSRPTTSGSPAA